MATISGIAADLFRLSIDIADLDLQFNRMVQDLAEAMKDVPDVS